MSRHLRRAAGLLVLLTVLSPGARSWAAGPAAPDVFEVLTTAVGVTVQSTQRPAASVVTGGLVDATVGYSSSALSSAGASQTAAAAFYPGDLVATGPALLCSEFLPCPVDPPAYPLLAQASYPDRPSSSADSPAPAGTADAVAGEHATRGTARTSGAAAAGAVAIGAQSTSTQAWVDVHGAHVRSRSTLHDVSVGPLLVAALNATDDVDVAVDGTVRDEPHVQLTGVTVAGQAASVDETGVHLLGVSQPASVPALTQQGIDVRLMGRTASHGSGAARSTAGGLRLTFSVPVHGVPPLVPGAPDPNRSYLGTVIIGGVGAAVAVGASGSALLDTLPPATPRSLDAVLLPARSLPPGAPAAAPAALQATPALAAPVATRSPRRPLQPVDLAALALALAVVPTALLGGWRLAVALRRGRA